jgi:hypothetical protein
MARYRLESARWLTNGWLLIVYRGAGRMSRRMVRPGQSVTLAEAAKALKTYRSALYRLVERGELRIQKGGPALVPWRELIRLRRAAR